MGMMKRLLEDSAEELCIPEIDDERVVAHAQMKMEILAKGCKECDSFDFDVCNDGCQDCYDSDIEYCPVCMGELVKTENGAWCPFKDCEAYNQNVMLGGKDGEG